MDSRTNGFRLLWRLYGTLYDKGKLRYSDTVMAQELDTPPEPRFRPEFARIVQAGVAANREVSGSIALGGTVCSLYAGHRLSRDIDFGMSDLRERFQTVREHLFELPDWKEARIRAPLLILGSLSGVDIGFRQLRRQTPIATVELNTDYGSLTVPSFDEMLMTKAYLLSERNYTRDFVDFAELSMLSTVARAAQILGGMDARFAWEKQPSVVLNVLKSLMAADPHDRDSHGYGTFKWLEPRLKSWEAVQERCRQIGTELSRLLMEHSP